MKTCSSKQNGTVSEWETRERDLVRSEKLIKTSGSSNWGPASRSQKLVNVSKSSFLSRGLIVHLLLQRRCDLMTRGNNLDLPVPVLP